MNLLPLFDEITHTDYVKALDSADDPIALLDSTLAHIGEYIEQLKSEMEQVYADAERIRRKVELCRGELQDYLAFAQRAAEAGHDRDALGFLAKKAEVSERERLLSEQCTQAVTNISRANYLYHWLNDQAELLRLRRAALNANSFRFRAAAQTDDGDVLEKELALIKADIQE